MKYWDGFKKGKWNESVDVRDFIQKNFTLYEGDASFLAGPTENTKKVWEKDSGYLRRLSFVCVASARFIHLK